MRTGEFVVSKTVGPLTSTFFSGSFSYTGVGFLQLYLDLNALDTAAIGECAGRFETASINVRVNVDARSPEITRDSPRLGEHRRPRQRRRLRLRVCGRGCYQRSSLMASDSS